MSGEPTTGKNHRLWRQIRAWAAVCLLYGIALALAVAGIVILRHAFVTRIDITDRIYRLLAGAALLAFPALVVSYLIPAKWAFGNWRPTREHALQRATQCTMRPQNAIAPQQRSLVLFVLHWANIALRAPQSPLFKRLIGLLVLFLYAAALLAICGLSVILVGAGIATFASLGWMMILFGLILLIIPAQFIAGIVHRRRTHGNLQSSDDDLVGIMAARSLWFQQGRRQSLRTKLFSTAIFLAFLTVLWLRVTVYHSRHPHETWAMPFIWTLVGIYLVWNQFRRPKAAPLK